MALDDCAHGRTLDAFYLSLITSHFILLGGIGLETKDRELRVGRGTAAVRSDERAHEMIQARPQLVEHFACDDGKATHVYNRYPYDREKKIALETWERVLTGILTNTSSANVLIFTQASAIKASK